MIWHLGLSLACVLAATWAVRVGWPLTGSAVDRDRPIELHLYRVRAIGRWTYPTFTPKPYDWQRDDRRDYAHQSP